MMSIVLYLLGAIYLPLSTKAFLLPSIGSGHYPHPAFQRPSAPPSCQRLPTISVRDPTVTSLFENKLWDRMEIEEDEEKLWYCLNCVAGLEMDLLRQCRQRCQDMDDVEKFVVPMMTTIRSHGVKRMVKDTKVMYQGYVFAKLRLCPETYEVIQELDLCRSWMGTINIKGHRKLPPSPLSMNDDEIEKFGLEECEAEEPQEEEQDENGVILDNKDEPEVDPSLEEAVKTTYLGLRVGDMVKVTAKNKFSNEDAVVRRLKEGKLFLRFYTYGSMYEEWMEPGEVRKLTEEEVLKGLSGPQQPITQRDIDGPSLGEDRDRFQEDDRSRRNMVSNFGGDQNRRQGRNAERYDSNIERDTKRNDDNWQDYKENQRRNQGGYNDGEYEIQGSKEQRGETWTQSDVDSQWGRTSQRQNRREKRKTPASEGGDWSAFVSSPGGKDQPSQAETDDFFASLMTDLSNDSVSEKKPKQERKGDSKASAYTSSDDDFFASLISEIEDEDSGPPPQKFQSDHEDFFTSLAEELRDDVPTKKGGVARDEEDFFAVFATEMEPDDKALAPKEAGAKSSTPKKANTADELESFFSELGVFEDDRPNSPESGESFDFFSTLEAELESQLSSSTSEEAAINEVQPSRSRGVGTAPRVDKIGATDLGGRTVPELKEMLRERGLKVSGKKSELIERLTAV